MEQVKIKIRYSSTPDLKTILPRDYTEVPTNYSLILRRFNYYGHFVRVNSEIRDSLHLFI